MGVFQNGITPEFITNLSKGKIFVFGKINL